MYWGKYFLFDLPELREFDALLVLDNDVLISPGAPLIFDSWNPRCVGMVDERAQFGWSDDHARRYYAEYELQIPAPAGDLHILNGGVLLYGKQHVELFRSIFHSWLDWRSAAPAARNWRTKFKYANDQPHVGLALQSAGVAQALDPRFNRIWWSWWLKDQKRAEWPFKLYAKASKILTGALPRAFTDPVAAPGLHVIERVLRENYFLHFAGSKSPFHLLAHRPDPRLYLSTSERSNA